MTGVFRVWRAVWSLFPLKRLTEATVQNWSEELNSKLCFSTGHCLHFLGFKETMKSNSYLGSFGEICSRGSLRDQPPGAGARDKNQRLAQKGSREGRTAAQGEKTCVSQPHSVEGPEGAEPRQAVPR